MTTRSKSAITVRTCRHEAVLRSPFSVLFPALIISARAADGLDLVNNTLSLNTDYESEGFELWSDTVPRGAGIPTLNRTRFFSYNPQAEWVWERYDALDVHRANARTQMLLDEFSALHLYPATGTSLAPTITFDPNVPKGWIGGQEILTKGNTADWLKTQDLEVDDLTVTGRVTGDLDVAGKLTVRSNIIAYGDLDYRPPPPQGSPPETGLTGYSAYFQDISDQGGFVDISNAAYRDGVNWAWKVRSQGIPVRESGFVENLHLHGHAFNTLFQVKHGWTGQPGVDVAVTGPLRRSDVPALGGTEQEIDSWMGTHSVLRMRNILTGATAVQLSGIAPNPQKATEGDPTFIMNRTGIGTQNPEAQLHVAGDLKVTGDAILSVPARGGISMGPYTP